MTNSTNDDQSSPSNSTRYDILVGLHIHDQEGYQRYRDGMTPILESMGGSFNYDFTVSKHLKGNSDDPINRVFVISFPSEDVMNTFFEHPDYKEIRKSHFDSSVTSSTIIARYHT